MINASFLSRAILVVLVFFTLVVVSAVPINSQIATTDNRSNATTSTTTNDTNISSEASTVLTKPPPLEKEHEQVHKTLATIVESSGNTAAVAKQVRTLMQPHFEK